jgi:hypothetical protein
MRLIAGRHWRTWLHAKSRAGELIPFASWLKDAFRIVPIENARPLVTVVDRRGTRAVLNMHQLIASLQSEFPHLEIRRQAFEDLSFREQLKVLLFFCLG